MKWLPDSRELVSVCLSLCVLPNGSLLSEEAYQSLQHRISDCNDSKVLINTQPSTPRISHPK